MKIWIYIANKVVKLMVKKGHRVKNAKALILGITFKENCPDIRNSKVIDVIDEFKEFGMQVDVYDPYANIEEVKREYNIDLLKKIEHTYDTIVLTVGHEEFRNIEIKKIGNSNAVIYDVKSFLPKELITDRL